MSGAARRAVIAEHLKTLKLPGLAREYEGRARQARGRPANVRVRAAPSQSDASVRPRLARVAAGFFPQDIHVRRGERARVYGSSSS